MTAETQHGYLVFADISGYTAYLARVELEHAHEILTDLLEGILGEFKSMLTISKLEGDAVFAYINENQLPRPEALLEMIERTYAGFCQRRDSSQRRTTCECRACQSMSSLELKFFIHHGDYIIQHISGIRELVGSDVNLLHRLTKNHISDATGWKAYVLLTQTALECLQLPLEGLHTQTESYEHLGEVNTLSFDLRARYQALTEVARIIIPPEEADLSLSCEYEYPLAQVWQYVTDAKLLTQTMRAGAHWDIVGRPGGRLGVGAKNHCAHGKGVMAYTYLDWRPFEYYTALGEEKGQKHLEMFLVESLPTKNRDYSIPPGDKTRLTVRLKLVMNLPRWFTRWLCSFLVKRDFLEFFERTRKLMNSQLDPRNIPDSS